MPQRAPSSAPRLAVPANTPLIFTAGRLVRKKGFEYLIDALPLVDGAAEPVLAIAGTGDLAGELTARAAAAGVAARIRFLGNIPQDQVGRWFAAADVAVVPSVRDDSGNVDGLPNTVMEALASGTPLVATAAGGIGAVVEDGRTGLIVRNGAPTPWLVLSVCCCAIRRPEPAWAPTRGSWSRPVMAGIPSPAASKRPTIAPLPSPYTVDKIWPFSHVQRQLPRRGVARGSRAQRVLSRV